MMECPTDGCDYMFFKEAENQTYHFCPLCGIEYCLACNIVYHVEMTCEEVKQAAIEAKAKQIND